MRSMRMVCLISLMIITSSAMSLTCVNADSENVTDCSRAAYACICCSSDPSISAVIQSDKLQWRYKWINGVLYKRLYNLSKNKWVGDWIKA